MNDVAGSGRAVTAADGSSPVQLFSTDQVAAHDDLVDPPRAGEPIREIAMR